MTEKACNIKARSPSIWLLQDGEPLPIDQEPRLLRTGILAERLIDTGFSVTWWASRFNHSLKTHRKHAKTFCELKNGYQLYLLDGPGYKKNISLSRIGHHRHCAANFTRLAGMLPKPNIILASYPSPELCHAGKTFAKKHSIPFIIDVRDPWPDIFPQYFSLIARWATYPLVYYYRRMFRSIAAEAIGIVSVSKAMLKWAINYSGRKESNADQVFYIGYDIPAVQRKIEIPDRHFTEETPLICLFISTGGRSYDGTTMIEAARLLEARGERRIRFMITGDGEMHSTWIKQASGLKSITFTGWISHQELQALLSKAHVGLILMHGGITRFWLGNKIAEYLSTFLVLINNVPGEPEEIIKNNQIGAVIRPKDPAALTAILKGLVNAPHMVKQYMENSRKVFFEVFEREKIYENYVKYLDQHLNGSKIRDTPQYDNPVETTSCKRWRHI